MLFGLYVGKLSTFSWFCLIGLEQTLINLKAIEIFEYLLLQLNKLSNFSCDIDYIELCPAALHMGH